MLAGLPDWAPSCWRDPWPPLLLSAIFCLVVYGEARLGKAKQWGDRYVMVSGWFFRLLFLLPALGLGALIVYMIFTSRPERAAHYFFFLLPGSFFLGAALVAIDSLVRRVIYDARGIELIALLARRRRVFIEWSDIREVRAAWDKIKLTTDTGTFAVYTHLKGCKGLMAELRTACPKASFGGSY